MNFYNMTEINTKFDNIKELNKYLIDNNYKIQLIEYVKYCQLKFNKDIDISFMDYFLEICDKSNEFIIHHKKLQEYGVINKISTTNNIISCLKQFEIVENIDYQVLLNVQQNSKLGERPMNIYTLLQST